MPRIRLILLLLLLLLLLLSLSRRLILLRTDDLCHPRIRGIFLARAHADNPANEEPLWSGKRRLRPPAPDACKGLQRNQRRP